MGTGAWHVGEDADPRARAALARSGYELEHRARQASMSALADTHLVLAMDSANLRDLTAMGVESVLIRTFDPDADDVDVPDPYYGDAVGFDEVVAMIQSAASGVRAYVERRT